jgi:hypothetical protein
MLGPARSTDLRFQPRPGRIVIDRSRYPPGPERGPAALGHFYFVHPVALRVGGTELFGLPDRPFTNLALLHVAIGLTTALTNCVRHGESQFELLVGAGNALTLRCAGGMVELAGPYGAVASDTIEDLQSAVRAFSDDVREFLLTEFPELVEDRTYGWWFRGESHASP